jgi:hypothetical protein
MGTLTFLPSVGDVAAAAVVGEDPRRLTSTKNDLELGEDEKGSNISVDVNSSERRRRVVETGIGISVLTARGWYESERSLLHGYHISENPSTTFDVDRHTTGDMHAKK